MRRIAAVLSTVVVVAAPVGNAIASLRGAAVAAVKKKVVTKKVAGPTEQADRWGTVQVVLIVRKTTTTTASGVKNVTRRITDLTGTYSYHTDRSAFIMGQSLPQLRQEALQAQTAQIDMVSGATFTSQAFIQSLQAALLLEKKV
jgi:uncharacterized protein with FMN-binding domain